MGPWGEPGEIGVVMSFYGGDRNICFCKVVLRSSGKECCRLGKQRADSCLLLWWPAESFPGPTLERCGTGACSRQRLVLGEIDLDRDSAADPSSAEKIQLHPTSFICASVYAMHC